MSLKNQLLECLKIEDKTKRQICIAGIITETLEPLGITPIVVGGAAVGFYTVGQYSTMDIDFVGIINDDMKKKLSDLGFQKHGRYWRIPDTDIQIEFPSDKLVGNTDKVEPIEYNGKVAYFIGIDDLIINRVQEAEHWNDLNSFEWARTLMVSHYDLIDWPYCHKRANELYCKEKFEQIQRDAKKIKRQMDRE